MQDDELILGVLVLIGGALFFQNRAGERLAVAPGDGPALRFDNFPTVENAALIAPSVAPAPAARERDNLQADPVLDFDSFENAASERDVVARTIYGEARDQGRAGMAAVAAVIRNRAADGRFGGRTARGVALAKFQFSVWNDDNANRRASLRADTSDAQYRVALQLYDQVVLFGNDTDVPPVARTATHYYVTNSPRPFWADKIAFHGVHGAHSFFREA